MKKCLIASVSLLMLGVAMAQTPSASATQAPPDLKQIMGVMPASPESSGIPSIRFNAIRETAITYGSQAGLARRNFENQRTLDQTAQKLDVVYNFQALMIEGNVVPPVLSELNEVYDQASDDLLRVINKVFRIEQQARFSYTPPTWRSYLSQSFDFNTNVVASVAPKNEEEAKVWRAGVEEGFSLGQQLADANLKENFARLQKDFNGMVLYHRMLASGMVTKPFVASSSLGVTRSKDGSMHVGEVVLRITANPDFVDSPQDWKAGPASVVSERLKRSVDPRFSDQVMRDARAAGIIRDGSGK